MLKCLPRGGTLRAGVVGFFVEPRRVCGEVTFACSHLVNPACDKLVKPHEGVRFMA